jgi:hypothetical protein
MRPTEYGASARHPRPPPSREVLIRQPHNATATVFEEHLEMRGVFIAAVCDENHVLPAASRALSHRRGGPSSSVVSMAFVSIVRPRANRPAAGREDLARKGA